MAADFPMSLNTSEKKVKRADLAPRMAMSPDALDSRQLLKVLRAVKKGDFSVRLPHDQTGVAGDIAEAFNDVVELNEKITAELERLSTVVGKEGKIAQRASLG